jgi:thioredoxin-like negative regulator of GroEL
MNQIKLNELLHEGNEAHLKGDYREALKLFHQARQEAPGDSTARKSHYRAATELALQQTHLTFKQKLKKYVLVLSYHLIPRKQMAKRYKRCEQIWLMHPTSERTTQILIQSAIKSGKIKFALQALQALSQAQPNEMTLMYRLLALTQQHQYLPIEIETLEALTRLEPENQELSTALQIALEKSQPTEDPKNALKKKLEEDPHNVDLRMQYLDSQLRTRQFDQAISELTHYLNELETPQPRLEKRLYLAREHQINFKLAAAQDQHDTDLIDSLRRDHDQLRIEHIKLQVERSPNDLQLRFDCGKVLYDCREWEQALTQFQHAMHHRQRRIRSLIYRSQILEKLKRHTEAEQELKIALAELPEQTREKQEVIQQLERLGL